MKVISIIKNELWERNVGSEVVIEEIVKQHIFKIGVPNQRLLKHLRPHLSTSILPIDMLANSMFDEPETNMVKDVPQTIEQNQLTTNMIPDVNPENLRIEAPKQLTTDMITGVTPENLTFEETEINEEQGVPKRFKSAHSRTFEFVCSNDKIILPDLGSYISLNNISVIHLNEIEISHQSQSTKLLTLENEN